MANSNCNKYNCLNYSLVVELCFPGRKYAYILTQYEFMQTRLGSAIETYSNFLSRPHTARKEAIFYFNESHTSRQRPN